MTKSRVWRFWLLESIWTSVPLQAWRTHVWCRHSGRVRTLTNTERPPLVCSWPRTCRRSAACLHGVMLSFKQHVVRASGGGVGVSDEALHTCSQHEALSTCKDNSGLHIHVWVLGWAPLKWSDVMFAQMCGSKAKRPNPQYPSGGLGPPPTAKDGASCQSHHGWHNLKGPSRASRGSHMKMDVHLRYFCCFLQWKQ